MSKDNKKYKYYNITIWLRGGDAVFINEIGMTTYERLIRVWNNGSPKLFKSMKDGKVITVLVSEIVAVERRPV